MWDIKHRAFSGRLHRIIGAVAALWLTGVVALPAADSLEWSTTQGRVSADIAAWELPRLLEELATVTGWQIWVDPGARHRVSTKFKDRPADKALELLLGDLSYARLPQTSGPPRLLVFRTSQKDATQFVPGRDKVARGKPIPNELIVTLKGGASIDELAKKLGATVVARSEGRNAARLRFADADAAKAARERLLQDEGVGAVDPNYPVVGQPGADALGLGGLPGLKLAPLKDGEGIIVGLIDSTVQRQGGNLDGFLLPGISLAGETTPPEDSPTHGTSMWETLLKGVAASKDGAAASRVRVLPVDVYGNNATTSTFEIAEGILRAMKEGAGVINLSLGSEGDTPFLHEIIKEGQKAGRVFVASAGNEPVTHPTFPAAYPEVIAVTAGDGKGGIASYANRGDFVDVIAPGTSIISFNGQVWRVAGTSPATAFISGVIAGTADTSGKSPAEAAVSLLKNQRPIKPPPQ